MSNRRVTFECSDPVVNQLHSNIDWSLRGNFLSVPTDCPQRDERLGWLGDAQVFATNVDILPRRAGLLRQVAGRRHGCPSGPRARSPTWPPASVAGGAEPRVGATPGSSCPWTLYKMYGSLRPAARCYDAMSRWMAFTRRGTQITSGPAVSATTTGTGWRRMGTRTPHELLATAYWAYDATLMRPDGRGVGSRCGRGDYASSPRDRGGVRQPRSWTTTGGWHRHPDLVCAGPVPWTWCPALRARAADHLVDAVRSGQWHLTTGFIGVGSLLPASAVTGTRTSPIVCSARRRCPSWRYPIRQGATTIWERWDGWTAESGFQSPHMNSFNHYSLGSVGEWLYRFVAGIDQPKGHVGFERAEIRPHPGASMSWAGAVFRSTRGPIASTWRRHEDSLTFDVGLPSNVTASIHVPSTDPGGVRDQHGIGPTAVGAYCGGRGMDEAVFEVGPGPHRYVAEYRVLGSADGDEVAAVSRVVSRCSSGLRAAGPWRARRDGARTSPRTGSRGCPAGRPASRADRGWPPWPAPAAG